jgi:hypothetical protein
MSAVSYYFEFGTFYSLIEKLHTGHGDQ